MYLYLALTLAYQDELEKEEFIGKVLDKPSVAAHPSASLATLTSLTLLRYDCCMAQC